MTNPTMKKSSMESKDDARNLALLQKFKELENMWESQQKSRPPLPRTCSTASYTYRYRYSSTTVTSFDHHHHHLFQTSAATLMSSPRHRNPDVRVKNCSVEVEEILMDRRDAIMSGRFKGRQLFAEKTTAEESSLSRSYSGGGGGGMCSDWANGIQGREVMANYELSSDSRGSRSLPEAKAVVEVAEKRGGGRRREGKGGGCWVATASLGAVLIVLALLLICFSLSSNGNNFEELIPT